MRVSPKEWPAGWVATPLATICEIEIGKTPDRDQPIYWGGSHTWITIADMTTRVISTSKESITDKAIDDRQARLVKAGTLLMSFKLTIGKLAFAGTDLYTNEAIAALSIKEEFCKSVVSDFLYWALQSVPIAEEADLAVKGLTLNKKKLARILVPIPYPDDPARSLETQRRIVVRIEALLAELRECRKLHQAVVEDTNRLMEAVLGEIFNDLAVEYAMTKAADVCLSITDGNHTTPHYVDSGIPFLFVSNIVNRFVDFEHTKFVTEDYYGGITDSRKPEVGDVLYTVVGSYGVPVEVATNRPFCFQRHIAILKPNRELIYPSFLRWILDTPQVLNQAHKVVTGSAQKTLTLRYLRHRNVSRTLRQIST